MSMWTRLDTLPIQEGDIVILGHVREYLLHFLAQKSDIYSDFVSNNPLKVEDNFKACFSQNPTNHLMEEIL